MHNADLNTPQEFASVASRLSNEIAYHHEDGIDGKQASRVVVDGGFSVPKKINTPISHLEDGVTSIGRVQCRWQLPSGTWFSEEGVMRVQRFASDDGEWAYWDLRVSGKKNCKPCTLLAHQPALHVGEETCPHEKKRHFSDGPIAGI